MLAIVFRSTAVIAAVLVLTACTAAVEPETVAPTAPVIQIGEPGEPNRTLSPEEAAAIEAAGYSDVDVLFVRDMLHHHAQALVMTGFVADRASDPDISLLAERMQIGQKDEMALLEKWLQERGEAVRDPDDEHGHADMPGLLTDQEIADLEAAEGEEFDRLFLVSMIRHHEGAVAMVDALYAGGGGLEYALDDIARHIDSDQRIEISRMTTMLAANPPGS